VWIHPYLILSMTSDPYLSYLESISNYNVSEHSCSEGSHFFSTKLWPFALLLRLEIRLRCPRPRICCSHSCNPLRTRSLQACQQKGHEKQNMFDSVAARSIWMLKMIIPHHSFATICIRARIKVYHVENKVKLW